MLIDCEQPLNWSVWVYVYLTRAYFQEFAPHVESLYTHVWYIRQGHFDSLCAAVTNFH